MSKGLRSDGERGVDRGLIWARHLQRLPTSTPTPSPLKTDIPTFISSIISRAMTPRNTTGPCVFSPAIMEIKDKLEQIRALWRYITKMQPAPRLTIIPTTGPSEDIQYYVLHRDLNDYYPWSNSRLPADTPEYLVEALMVWNRCSITGFMLTEVLRRTLDGSRFEFGNMNFRAKTRFRFDGHKPQHTVITITNKEDGMIYVLDLTLEQFGWSKEDWLLPIAEYCGSYVKLSKQNKRPPEKLSIPTEYGPLEPAKRKIVFDKDLERIGHLYLEEVEYWKHIHKLLLDYDWDSWGGGDVLAELKEGIENIAHTDVFAFLASRI
ncbi:uncharacterized protein EI97DRAFT_70031 [Westerdykella ornata]|uniref:Uncharacterized protein n=1 Tax=Westerdykella ornata TaxID=318751 RepID=A0A6A6JHL1_WESOR|nr:uncharacterized protein EI97DRAFT_70031 [Westerdykella ornata]KAF2275705.1 hypothetical protein EI97DRAFT_70031 [Westerdykella ornata]